MRAAVLALEAATPTGLAHSGPWRPGYLRLPAPPMPPRSSWPPRPRHHATTAIPQTGSTAEHATTPEHPCPGVVARTGPQAVNPSPVSGESMASGGYACGRASPPPTSPGNAADAAGVTARGGHRPAMAGHCGKRPRGAFFPGAAPEPGWRWRHQPGPWGRWPTRRCAAERHLTTDLPENASGAAGVTAAGEVPRHEQPRGPPSRGRSSSTYQQERLAACSRYIGAPSMPDAPYALVGNGGPRGLPRVTLDPPSVATRKHGDLVAPAPGQARGRLQAERAAPAGAPTGAARTGGPVTS
jgi:hypothetical protein